MAFQLMTEKQRVALRINSCLDKLSALNTDLSFARTTLHRELIEDDIRAYNIVLKFLQEENK